MRPIGEHELEASHLGSIPVLFKITNTKQSCILQAKPKLNYCGFLGAKPLPLPDIKILQIDVNNIFSSAIFERPLITFIFRIFPFFF